MIYSDIKSISLRRLGELEKQAALMGPHTEPSVLVEIQDIYNKYPEIRQLNSVNHSELDYDFLMNTVAAALQRITGLEAKFDGNDKSRINRQFLHDLWMGTITILIVLTLALVIVHY